MSTIDEIVNWFEQAVPEPTKKSKAIQIGVHFEECGEMARAIGDGNYAEYIEELSETWKYEPDWLQLDHIDKLELLDALCDQIVTAIGVAHMFGFDIRGALAEVSRSNNSKFVDGKPIFNEQGKIQKGPSYSKPDLTPYL